MPAITQPERSRPGLALSGTKGSPIDLRKGGVPEGHAPLIVRQCLRQGLQPCPGSRRLRRPSVLASGGKPGPPGGVAHGIEKRLPDVTTGNGQRHRPAEIAHRLSRRESLQPMDNSSPSDRGQATGDGRRLGRVAMRKSGQPGKPGEGRE